MEEYENKPEEGGATAANTAETVVEKEPEQETKQPLSREEILAISRKENKNGDEREAQALRKGYQLAFSVGVLLIGVIVLVKVILSGKMPAELWIVYMAMLATWSLYYSVKTGKHKGLFIASGTLSFIACVFWTVYWILQLCGVVL